MKIDNNNEQQSAGKVPMGMLLANGGRSGMCFGAKYFQGLLTRCCYLYPGVM